MIATTRIVPVRTASASRPISRSRRRSRNRRIVPHRGHPENGKRYQIAEIFNIEDDDYDEMDVLLDHVLRRGSIKGRTL
ncbi:MAG: hypothetical protein AB1696_01210 [Planctomycetota bacterium]